ncbi:type II toxin-antitoxin system YoeB family toxin [Streptomyces sp. NBC_00988]|nr:type II toxin-antitoxin system YoeB family toxin [Streptomyces sp. NBC_00988]
MRDVNFDPAAWDDLQHWLATDRKMVRRIVYRADDKQVKILKARYHYTD